MRFRTSLAAAAFAACVFSQMGCQGMIMDENAAVERGKKATNGKDYRVVVLNPTVIADLAKESVAIPTDKDPNAGVKPGPYKIAPFDVLQVTVWEHPELTTPAGANNVVLPDPMGSSAGLTSGAGNANGIGVDANGDIFYPHVGTLNVAGKTLAEVRKDLTKELARVLVNPQLDVRVSSYRGKRVQITGEVQNPSTMPLTDLPLRVQDAIGYAHGFLPESSGVNMPSGPGADLSRVTLTRSGKTYRLDLLALYERGDQSQNWLLEDGDVINVGDRNRNRVFILGEVRTPQARLMVRRRMTLAEAISDTGGLDPLGANVSDIYVIRGDLQAPNIYRLNAKSADAVILATQFQLRPLDVVYVSSYTLTRWNRVMSQILPTVTVLYEGFVSAGVVNTISK